MVHPKWPQKVKRFDPILYNEKFFQKYNFRNDGDYIDKTLISTTEEFVYPSEK